MILSDITDFRGTSQFDILLAPSGPSGLKPDWTRSEPLKHPAAAILEFYARRKLVARADLEPHWNRELQRLDTSIQFQDKALEGRALTALEQQWLLVILDVQWDGAGRRLFRCPHSNEGCR